MNTKFIMINITGHQSLLVPKILVLSIIWTTIIGTMAQMYKYEPQSLHFSKQQYSLHGTVRAEYLDSQPTHNYLYHLSDEMKHDYAFTASVVDHVLSLEVLPEILRFKSDNCSTQYKAKYVFEYWQSLSMKLNGNVIVYYGVSGHGKSLVDTMNGLGVKGPIKKAVLRENFSYHKALDIQEYLIEKFRDDPCKKYFLVDLAQINDHRSKTSMKIKGCRKQHTI